MVIHAIKPKNLTIRPSHLEHQQSDSQPKTTSLTFNPTEMASLSREQSPPPPVYKPTTLTIQQSPLGSHPLPSLPPLPPPPSYKRSPSPSPSTISQPSLHDLPKYTPRAPSPSATPTPAPKSKLDPNLNTWSAWIPWKWASTPTPGPEYERKKCMTRGRTGRARDPMAGSAGAELDACELYESRQRKVKERGERGSEAGEWCCGCFWVGPPMPMASYYIF
ncbi:hypothetical protein VTL71DRAFT_1355 [Oculimacula yallundae]|uniref:Uncharacterized protein n=1 Tax=Oculimacula yallundae TaxID=86028 RepID=A0ABR4CCD8_9HELO